MKNNWYVITGAPSSGKTTTLSLLKKEGYTITHETARQYYESQLQLGLTNQQIRANPQKLQDNIFTLQVQLESSLDPQQELFLDRAIPDSFAYYDFLKLTMPPAFPMLKKTLFYRHIFFLEPVPFQSDAVRTESPQEALEISECIYRHYAELGLPLTRIPLMPREKRVEYILTFLPKKL